VLSELETRPVKAIVLSGPGESVARLKWYLPERVAALVAGRITLPITSGRAELAHAAGEVIMQAQRHHQLALVNELRERAAEGAAAVTGLAPTLEALGAERVGTLVVEKGFETDGGRCLNCGQLVADGGFCPVCGTTLTAVENVVDAAVTRAFAHHVTLEFCEDGDLAGLGRIGALERHTSTRSTWSYGDA